MHLTIKSFRVVSGWSICQLKRSIMERRGATLDDSSTLLSYRNWASIFLPFMHKIWFCLARTSRIKKCIYLCLKIHARLWIPFLLEQIKTAAAKPHPHLVWGPLQWNSGRWNMCLTWKYTKIFSMYKYSFLSLSQGDSIFYCTSSISECAIEM